MKEIIEQYGQTILAVVVTLAVLAIFFNVWTNQLRAGLLAYEDSTAGGSGDLGKDIEESNGACYINLKEVICEKGIEKETLYQADEIFTLADSKKENLDTTGGIRLIRAYDQDGNDVTGKTIAQTQDACYFFAEQPGAYRVRVRCNDADTGCLADAWFVLAVSEAESKTEEA